MVEPRTLRGDAFSIENHVMPYWTAWELRDITRMDARVWNRSLAEKGMGPSASRRSYSLVPSIRHLAMDDDVLAVTPTSEDQPAGHGGETAAVVQA